MHPCMECNSNTTLIACEQCEQRAWDAISRYMSWLAMLPGKEARLKHKQAGEEHKTSTA